MGFLKAVADGTITANGEIVGGSGKYTLSNVKGDSAFKIEYHESRQLNTYKVFYYRHHQLIYAKFALKTATNFPTSLYDREEFYQVDMRSIEPTNKLADVQQKTGIHFYLEDDMRVTGKIPVEN